MLTSARRRSTGGGPGGYSVDARARLLGSSVTTAGTLPFICMMLLIADRIHRVRLSIFTFRYAAKPAYCPCSPKKKRNGRPDAMNPHIEPLNLAGTRSTASVISPRQNGTRWNASLPKHGTVAPLLLFVVFTQLSTFNPQPLQAATFTTNALIAETDTSFDGQDVMVSGATLTVDGWHCFNSLLLTNGAVLT